MGHPQFRLSILICSVPEREVSYHDLMTNLLYQSNLKGVQLLSLHDNMSMSVGAKRNWLLKMAVGEWLCFVDDDDNYYSGALDKILQAIRDNPGKRVIAFRGTQNQNGRKTLDFRFDVNYGRNHRTRLNGEQIRGMIPNHLCVWKSDIAKRVEFQDTNLMEDHRWAEAMRQHYNPQDQHIIEEKIYHYEFNHATSLCRRR